MNMKAFGILLFLPNYFYVNLYNHLYDNLIEISENLRSIE